MRTVPFLPSSTLFRFLRFIQLDGWMGCGLFDLWNGEGKKNSRHVDGMDGEFFLFSFFQFFLVCLGSGI
jgi:hypothetical protein